MAESEIEAAAAPEPAAETPAPEPEPAQPRTEADEDAFRELEAADRAVAGEGFNLPGADPLPMADPLAPPFDYPPAATATSGIGGPEPAALRTLDDLYARHPDIGDGRKWIIVNRKSPTRYNGAWIGGQVAEVDHPITRSDFLDQFGGGRYELLVQGPTSSMGPDGRYVYRTVGRFTLELPGAPKVGATQEADVSRPVMGTHAGNEKYELARLQFDQERQRATEEKADKYLQQVIDSKQADGMVVGAMKDIGDQRVAEMRMTMAETTKMQSATIDSLRADVARRDKELEDLRKKLVDTEKEAVQAAQTKETERIVELKERYQTQIDQLKEDHRRSVESLAKEHDRRMHEQSESHARERRDVESRASEERNRLQEDMRRREDQVQNDRRASEQSLRESYESRIKEVERSLEREIRSLKEGRDRELLTVQTTGETKATLAEKTAEMHVSALNSECERLRAELTALQADNQRLRDRFNKSALQEIHEARGLLEELGLSVGAQGQEGEFDWRRGALSLVGNVLNKDTLKDIATGLGAAREENRRRAEVGRAHAVAAARARQGYGLPQARPVQMAHPAPPAQPSQPAAPVPMAATAAEPKAEAKAEAEPAAEPSRAYRPESPAAADRPKWGTPKAEAPKPEAAAAEPAQAAAAQEQRPLTPEEAAAAVPPEVQQKIFEFVDQVEAAVVGGFPPGDFADRVIEQIGPGTTATIHSSIQPEQLADSIAQHPEGKKSALASPSGRKFLSELWEALGEKLSAAEGGEA